MEMWRKDKNYSFRMKYAVISWAIPLESQAGIKAWDWREPQNHAAQPMHSDHNPQGPAEEWLCSTHCSAMRDEYTPCEEQTHWCGDFIKAPAAWRSSLRNLNLSGDFSCFQSSACFFHLGYWLKGAEKCSTDNKWSIFKKYHCCVESPGIWRFQTGAPLDIQCWKMRLDRRQQNDLLSSWTYFTACQSATLNEREKKTFVMWTWVEIFWSTLFFFLLLLLVSLGIFFSEPLKTQFELWGSRWELWSILVLPLLWALLEEEASWTYTARWSWSLGRCRGKKEESLSRSLQWGYGDKSGCSRWKPPMVVGSRILCTTVFFTELQEMIIYSESFLIKEHKALQLIKLIKRIKLVKNGFIKTFTFL